MTNKLKPCPWCGREAVMRSHESHLNANSIMYSASCSSEWCCECPSGWHKSKNTATKRWNTRASDDETQQIIKAAVQAIEDIMPGTWDNKCWVCRRYLLAAGTSSKNPSCLSCDILSLKPHLQALKGLIDV